VHGSDVKFDLRPPSPAFVFLTETLEFVFIASEFVEFGWDIRRMIAKGSSMTHPFGTFLVNYQPRLRELQANVASFDP
jgi:hypothetical protein